MTFKDTYAETVLDIRRSRSKRARIWAKITGVALVLTLAATLRSEPELGTALMTAGVDGMMKLTGETAPPAPQAPDMTALEGLIQKIGAPGSEPVAQETAVRINRPNGWRHDGARFEQVTPPPSAQDKAEEIKAISQQMDSLLKLLGKGQ